MSLLTTLVFVTPLFGLPLTLELPAAPSLAVPSLAVPSLAVPSLAVPSLAVPSLAVPSLAVPSNVLPPVEAALTRKGEEPTEDRAPSFAETMEVRGRWASIHRPFGIATWAAMLTTVVLGGIQYYNLYGLFASQNENPCVRGRAIFGQSQCFGPPWPHRIASWTTAALYAATMTFSILMPDPGGLDKGAGAFARKLRMHKILRWVHFGGMLGQIILGAVTANSHWVGLDRANNYRAAQALATTHMALGMVTFGAMTWAAAIMVF